MQKNNCRISRFCRHLHHMVCPCLAAPFVLEAPGKSWRRPSRGTRLLYHSPLTTHHSTPPSLRCPLCRCCLCCRCCRRAVNSVHRAKPAVETAGGQTLKVGECDHEIIKGFVVRGRGLRRDRLVHQQVFDFHALGGQERFARILEEPCPRLSGGLPRRHPTRR